MDEQLEIVVYLHYGGNKMKKKVETVWDLMARFKKENSKRHKKIHSIGESNYFNFGSSKRGLSTEEHKARDFKAIGFSSCKEKIISCGWWDFKVTEDEMFIVALDFIEERKEYSNAPITKSWLKKELTKFCENTCTDFDKSYKYYSYFENRFPIEKMIERVVAKVIK